MNRNIMKELPPCLPLTVRTILRLPVLQGFSPRLLTKCLKRVCCGASSGQGMEAAAEMTFHFALARAFCKMMLTHPSFPHRTRHFLLVIAPVLRTPAGAGPGCVSPILHPNLVQIRSRENDTSQSFSLFLCLLGSQFHRGMLQLPASSECERPLEICKRGRKASLRRPSCSLTGSPWSSMPLFCLAATDVVCRLAWSCGCRQRLC